MKTDPITLITTTRDNQSNVYVIATVKHKGKSGGSIMVLYMYV